MVFSSYSALTFILSFVSKGKGKVVPVLN